MFDCGLVDLEYHGMRYTWSNNQLGGKYIKERLDRALGNLCFLENFPKSVIFNLEPIGSDHSPVIFYSTFNDRRTPKVFKFESFWIDHPGYHEFIENCWREGGRAWKGVVEDPISRLNHSRRCLIDWSKSNFPNSALLAASLVEELRVLLRG